MKILILLLASSSLLASGDHHHAEEISLGAGAVKNFGITCAPYDKSHFPPSAIVRSGHDSSIYLCRGQKFLRSHVEDVTSGDSVVVTGANFLKTVELSLEEGPSDGHGH